MTTTQAIERVRDVIRRQHKAFATEDTYVFWLRRYMRAVAQMPKGLTSEKKVELFPLSWPAAFLVFITADEHFALHSQV